MNATVCFLIKIARRSGLPPMVGDLTCSTSQLSQSPVSSAGVSSGNKPPHEEYKYLSNNLSGGWPYTLRSLNVQFPPQRFCVVLKENSIVSSLSSACLPCFYIYLTSSQQVFKQWHKLFTFGVCFSFQRTLKCVGKLQTNPRAPFLSQTLYFYFFFDC